MISDTYIHFPGIKGDSTVTGHEGWIEVPSWSLGASSGEPIQGQTENVPTEYQDLNFVKSMDPASPSLLRWFAEGKLIDQIVLEIVKPGEDGYTFSQLVFGNCKISSYQMGGSSGDFIPMDQVSLSYSTIEWKFWSDKDTAPVSSLMIRRPKIPASPSGLIASEGSQSASPMLHQKQGVTVQFNSFEPKTAFVVMWMDPERPELEDVHLTIKDVCKQFGVQAKRADDVQHDDRITDVILEQIRTSEFVIADLSGERPNVYYEVGHAHSIGKRPILVKRKGTATHFDLAVHNVREYRNVTELREILTKRFEAILH